MNKDLSKIKDTELVKELESKRVEFRKLRFNMAGAGGKDTKKRSNLKKDISKILTEIRKRNLAK